MTASGMSTDTAGRRSEARAPVRVAVVGTGGIGRLHTDLAAALDETDLVGISSLEEGAGDLARGLSVPHFTDYRDLTGVEPEAVIVATPNNTHLEISGHFLERGLPVLVEKPIAQDTRAGRELCDMANAAGVPLLVGHHRRYHRRVVAARDLVAREVGTLIATNTLVTMRKPDSYYEVEWRRSEGAGPLLVNLIHEVDLLRAVCGEIDAVQAMSSKLGRGFGFEDTATLLFHFASGALGTLVIAESTPSPWSWEASVSDGMGFHNAGQDHAHFLGTEASFSFPSLTMWRYDRSEIDPGWAAPLHAARLTVDHRDPYRRVSGSAAQPWSIPMDNPYVEQVRHLARVVRGEEAPRVPGEEGLRSLAVVEAVISAARTGATVAITEVLDAV